MGKLANVEPPEHLSDASKNLWRQLVPSRVRSHGRRELFVVALGALERLIECRTTIAADGLMTKSLTTGARRGHSLLKHEEKARGQFTDIWKLLGLQWDQELDGVRLEFYLKKLAKDEGDEEDE